MKSRVSIVIPIYNAERFLKETIASVLSQSYTDFELILVNDGSTDNSESICLSFSDSRITYLKIDNAGVSNARNVGFGKSQGAYLAFLDADDVWLPERLEKTVDHLDRNEQVGLVHTYVQEIDEKSALKSKIFRGKEGNILDDLLLWEECCIPAPSSILVRREVMNKVGLFDLNISTAADHDLFFRVANSYEIGMVKEVLGLYRIHGDNMHMNIARMEKEHIYIYKKAAKLGLFKTEEFRKYCFANLYRVLSGSYWGNARNAISAIRCGVWSLYYRPSLKKFISFK